MLFCADAGAVRSAGIWPGGGKNRAVSWTVDNAFCHQQSVRFGRGTFWLGRTGISICAGKVIMPMILGSFSRITSCLSNWIQNKTPKIRPSTVRTTRKADGLFIPKIQKEGQSRSSMERPGSQKHPGGTESSLYFWFRRAFMSSSGVVIGAMP